MSDMKDRWIALATLLLLSFFLGACVGAGVMVPAAKRSEREIFNRETEYREREIEKLNKSWQERLTRDGLYEWRINPMTGEAEFARVLEQEER